MARTRRVARRSLAVLGVLLLAWLVFLVVAGARGATALRHVADRAPVLATQLGAADLVGAHRTATVLAKDAVAARRSTAQWPWRVTSRLPLLGDQMRALSAAADAAAVLGPALPEAIDAYAAIGGSQGHLVSSDGRVDLGRLRDLGPVVTDLASRSATADSILRQAERGRLLPQLRSRLSPVASQVSRTNGVLQGAAALVPRLPDMLGASGTRTYLVGFTNPGELRGAQGILGAYAVLTADHGRLQLTEAGSDLDIEQWKANPDLLGREFLDRYGHDAQILQNITLSPNAPYAGTLLASLWRASGRPEPDGAVFVDPVGLADLLVGHPPLKIANGERVAPGDLPRVLLYDVYKRFTGRNERKDFLTSATNVAFLAALQSGFSKDAIRGLATAVSQGHLAVWSRRTDEQQALVLSRLAGALPPPSRTARVSFVSIDRSKLNYWARAVLSAQPPCAALSASGGEGRTGAARITVRVSSAVPNDVPAYMLRKPTPDPVVARTMRLITSVYLPSGISVDGARVDGKVAAIADDQELGWRVVSLTLQVPQRRTSELVLELSGPADLLPTKVAGPAMVRQPQVSTGACLR